MSEIRVDNIVSADGSTAPSYTKGVNVSAGQTITNLGDFTTSGNTTLSGPVTFGSGARVTGVTTFADSLNNVNITGLTTFADGARVVGVVTFNDGVSGLNVLGPATFTQGANITGVVTFSQLSIQAGLTTFSGSVSVGGTLTYEDVTNIDAIGIITARSDIKGGRNLNVTGISTFDSDVKVGRNLNVIGISTFHTNSTVHVGSGVTIYGNNSLLHSVGIVSASSFHGSGANLTGIDATALKDAGGNVKIQANPAGAVVTGILTATTLDSPEIDVLNSNIAMLGFKIAANSTLSKYNLVDQVIDEYQDQTGIDVAASTNAGFAGSGTLKYYRGWSAVAGNYFGTGGDGDVTISGNTSLSLSNIQGSYDADMCIKQYNTLTINSGTTLTTNAPCRGLFIYVKGNCTINGTIDMTARGAYANPASTSSPSWGNAGSDGNTLGAQGLQLGLVKSGSTETLTNDGSGFNGCGTAVRNAVANQENIAGNGKIYRLGREGAAGGSGSHGNGFAVGNNGAAGTAANPCGGGGSGATSHNSVQNAGNGSAGTCWSGGTGGAGTHGSTPGGTSHHGQSHGGPGGGGNYGGNAGGAGNPGGGGNNGHGGTGETGTGGTIWLIVGGTLSGNGTIRSNGKNGGPFVTNTCGGGGGSGGGSAIVAAVTDSSSITMNMTGGTGTNTGGGGGSRNGGNGGTGYSIREGGITGAAIPGAEDNLVLQSTDSTASSAPSKGDLVTLIEDNAGTATLNTDIKGYISRDSGSTWSQGTLVNEGSWGTNKKILAFHNLDISGQPSGTAMCYKISTHNQSASKKTYIHATSLGWR